MMSAKSGKRSIVGTAILASWALVCLWPIFHFGTIALRPRNEIIAPQPIYWPTFTTETWAKIWAEWPILKYFMNSLLAVSGSVVICLVLGIPAAYALARYRFKGREDIGFYILSTKMMAPAVVAIPLFVMFAQFRMLDTVWALMLVYAAINLSIVVWIIRSYMIDIPHEIEDAARTDGASDLRILWEIIIPMCLPGHHHRRGDCRHLRHERVLPDAHHWAQGGFHPVDCARQLLRRFGWHHLQCHRAGRLPCFHPGGFAGDLDPEPPLAWPDHGCRQGLNRP